MRTKAACEGISENCLNGWLVALLPALLLLVCTSCDSTAPTPRAFEADALHGCTVYSENADSVREVMQRLARYQNRHIGNARAVWQEATYHVGMVEAFQATCEPLYLHQATRWAKALDWVPGKIDSEHRDVSDLSSSQVFLALHQMGVGGGTPEQLAPTRERLDLYVENRPRGREPWFFVDALFMAPPVFAQFHSITAEQPSERRSSYATRLDAMYWDVVDHLYNEETHLFYRDAELLGTDVYWGRGNGWAIASLPLILEQELPRQDRPRYRQLLKEMAAALAALQREDGLWGSDLKRPYRFDTPETSASGFFTYAIAWGINEGLLPEQTYGPVVRRAWAGLSDAVTDEGHLRWVQQGGSRPREVRERDRPRAYGSGAFLLAGSEVLRYVSE